MRLVWLLPGQVASFVFPHQATEPESKGCHQRCTANHNKQTNTIRTQNKADECDAERGEQTNEQANHCAESGLPINGIELRPFIGAIVPMPPGFLFSLVVLSRLFQVGYGLFPGLGMALLLI